MVVDRILALRFTTCEFNVGLSSLASQVSPVSTSQTLDYRIIVPHSGTLIDLAAHLVKKWMSKFVIKYTQISSKTVHMIHFEPYFGQKH